MANYAYIENGKIEQLLDNLPKNWKNISNFNTLSDGELNSVGWHRVEKEYPTFNSATHKLSNPEWIVDGNKPIERYGVVEKTPEYVYTPSPEKLLEDEWLKVRTARDNLLKEFDWRYIRYERQVRLGLPVQDNISDMDSYTQALADITQQPSPFNITWPVYNAQQDQEIPE